MPKQTKKAHKTNKHHGVCSVFANYFRVWGLPWSGVVTLSDTHWRKPFSPMLESIHVKALFLSKNSGHKTFPLTNT